MKKKVIAALSVLFVALITVTVIPTLDFVKKDNSYVQDDTEKEEEGKKPTKPRDLYPPDWETDIFTLDRYVEKNLYLEYGKLTGTWVTYSETLLNRTECQKRGGSALALMHDYFDLLRHGDHEGVNGLYRDDYFDGEEKKPYEAFPMQKIYDVLVCKYDYEDKNFEHLESMEPTYYLVTYKIMENDGLFRYELDSDVEQTQLFGVLTYADGTSEIYLVMDLPDFTINRTF